MDDDELRRRKSELRLRSRSRRAQLDPARRRDASRRICASVVSLPEFSSASHVLVYGAAPEEVDVFAVADAARNRGGHAYLPRVAGDDLEVVELTSATSLVAGFRGILEPEGAAVDPAVLDLVVVPGLAFDERGRRLGQGKGYYDRLLAASGAVRVAVAFDCQLAETVPADARDERMDVLVTESKTVRFAR